MREHGVDAFGALASRFIAAHDPFGHRIDEAPTGHDRFHVEIETLALQTLARLEGSFAQPGLHHEFALAVQARQQPERKGATGPLAGQIEADLLAHQGSQGVHLAGQRGVGRPQPIRTGPQRKRAEEVVEFSAEQVHPLTAAGDSAHEGNAESGPQGVEADVETVVAGGVEHVDHGDDRQIEFHDLKQQIQVPLEGRCVEDNHDRVGALLAAAAEDGVDRHLFFGRPCIEAVATRDIDQTHAAGPRQFENAVALLHGDAGMIAGAGAGSGQGVEQSRLARVGIARDSDCEQGLAGRSSGRHGHLGLKWFGSGSRTRRPC